MKKRLISVAIGLLILVGLFFCYDTVVLNLVFAAAGVLAILEAMRAFGTLKNRFFMVTALSSHILMIFIPIGYGFVVLFSLLFLMVVGTLFSAENRYPFRSGASTAVVVLTVSGGFSALLAQRELSSYISDGIFVMFLSLGLGWICDTFAFAFGKLFGKRKIFPTVSPNKTVAGFVAGICATPVFSAAFFWLYAANVPAESVFFGKLSALTILYFVAVGLVGAVVGIVGDLAASLIKRECGIKDFGNLMPGHGGALDRLDSVLFTSIFALGIYLLFLSIF